MRIRRITGMQPTQRDYRAGFDSETQFYRCFSSHARRQIITHKKKETIRPEAYICPWSLADSEWPNEPTALSPSLSLPLS